MVLMRALAKHIEQLVALLDDLMGMRPLPFTSSSATPAGATMSWSCQRCWLRRPNRVGARCHGFSTPVAS